MEGKASNTPPCTASVGRGNAGCRSFEQRCPKACGQPGFPSMDGLRLLPTLQRSDIGALRSSATNERQQVAIDDVGMDGKHAVRIAGIDL